MDRTPSFIGLVIASLATWRLTHMLWAEDGPWDVFAKARKLAGAGLIGKILDCFYCLSVWVALGPAAALARDWREGVFVWLALSGAAILLERITAERARPAAVWREDGPPDPP